MNHCGCGRIVARCVSLLPLVAAACMPATKAAEAPAVPPPYQANFTYKSPPTGQPVDVTLGILDPQFGEDASLYSKQSNPIVKNMLSSLDASVGELLVAKGFKTTGPYASLNDMTFPEKKAADLVLYPQVNFKAEVIYGPPHAAPPSAATEKKGTNLLEGLPFITPKNDAKPGTPGTATPQVCDAKLSVSGSVVFVVAEPESGAKMMNKVLKVDEADQTFAAQPCPGPGNTEWTREVNDAWAKAHEVLFQSSMKALDSYVNAEELQGFKSQSKELRDKKAY